MEGVNEQAVAFYAHYYPFLNVLYLVRLHVFVRKLYTLLTSHFNAPPQSFIPAFHPWFLAVEHLFIIVPWVSCARCHDVCHIVSCHFIATDITLHLIASLWSSNRPISVTTGWPCRVRECVDAL
jgi:hypothetical protein